MIGSRLISAGLLVAALVSGWLYVTALRARLENTRLQLVQVEAVAAAMEEAARKVSRQAQALEASRDATELEFRQRMDALRSAKGSCLDEELPSGLLD